MRVLWSSRAVLTAVAAFMVGLPTSLSRGKRTVLTATIISFLVGHRQYPKELHSPGHGQVIAHFVRSVEASTLMAKANASLFSHSLQWHNTVKGTLPLIVRRSTSSVTLQSAVL